MEQDLKGSVVNRAPVEPESRALSEPAGESKSCFPHHILWLFVLLHGKPFLLEIQFSGHSYPLSHFIFSYSSMQIGRYNRMEESLK